MPKKIVKKKKKKEPMSIDDIHRTIKLASSRRKTK